MKTKTAVLNGKPDAGNLLCKNLQIVAVLAGVAVCGGCRTAWEVAPDVEQTVKAGHDATWDEWRKTYPKRYLADTDTVEQQQALYRELWAHDPAAETRLWPAGKVPFRTGETRCRLDITELWQRNVIVRDVNDPFFVFYPAKGVEKAPVAVVCPGGGYACMGYNKEGTEIAEWLNSIGFSAAVLLYRVPDQRKAALADVQRAVRILRAKPGVYGIDPKKIGVIGFSAGANLTVAAATNWKRKVYERVDEIDDVSCRPDFQLPIYLWDVLPRDPKARMGLPLVGKDVPLAIRAEEYPVDAETPPAFLSQAEDDFCRIETTIAYHLALKRAGVSSEMHVFKSGGHGYGLRRLGTPCDAWSDLAAKWLSQFR